MQLAPESRPAASGAGGLGAVLHIPFHQLADLLAFALHKRSVARPRMRLHHLVDRSAQRIRALVQRDLARDDKGLEAGRDEDAQLVPDGIVLLLTLRHGGGGVYCRALGAAVSPQRL